MKRKILLLMTIFTFVFSFISFADVDDVQLSQAEIDEMNQQAAYEETTPYYDTYSEYTNVEERLSQSDIDEINQAASYNNNSYTDMNADMNVNMNIDPNANMNANMNISPITNTNMNVNMNIDPNSNSSTYVQPGVVQPITIEETLAQWEINEINNNAAYPSSSSSNRVYVYTVPETTITYYYEVPDRTVVYYYYDPVSTYANPYNLYWDGYYARWSCGGYATKYQVRLFKNNYQVTNQTTSGQVYDFNLFMTTAGDYYFEVRAYNPYGGWSSWETSGILSISAGGKRFIPANFGPTALPGTGKWVQANGCWFYQEATGFVTNAWRYINGKWYYFNPAGIMLTGWQTINGKRYYLNVPNGDMVIGTQVVDGVKRTFDANGVFLY